MCASSALPNIFDWTQHKTQNTTERHRDVSGTAPCSQAFSKKKLRTVSRPSASDSCRGPWVRTFSASPGETCRNLRRTTPLLSGPSACPLARNVHSHAHQVAGRSLTRMTVRSATSVNVSVHFNQALCCLLMFGVPVTFGK